MRRRWLSFHRETTDREFRALPEPDRVALFSAMLHYRMGHGVGFVTKHYGKGLMMIKAANRTAGRCLFFCAPPSDAGETTLIALAAYKKESVDAPERVLAAARHRMAEAIARLERGEEL